MGKKSNNKKSAFQQIWCFLILFSVVAFLLMISGCGTEGERDVKLQLLCGGGIRPPVDGSGEEGMGVIESFVSENPGIRIEANYGPSNHLLGQLKLTLDGDLFFPGDDFYIEEAKKEGLVYQTHTVAYFVPVIMVQEGNPHDIQSVADLVNPEINLAVADQRAAAIGRITPEIFEKNEIDFEELDNVAFTGVTAPEVAQQIKLGHVDATIVWRPVAAQYRRRSEIVDIKPEKNVISPLVIAVLETSDNKEEALKFAEYISGPTGRDIFERYYYDFANDK